MTPQKIVADFPKNATKFCFLENFGFLNFGFVCRFGLCEVQNDTKKSKISKTKISVSKKKRRVR